MLVFLDYSGLPVVHDWRKTLDTTVNYPDADIEQKLRDMNQSEEIIEQFFSTYPELRKQSQQTCIYDGSWFAFLCIFF